MTQHDGIKWNPYVRVDKYSPDQVSYATERLGHEPKGWELEALFSAPEDGFSEAHGNLLTTVGLQRITNLIIASGAGSLGTSTSTGKAGVGVGATATAATIGDVALGANATGSAWYQATDSAPTAVNGVLTAVSTFATGDGNFAWNEWCWFISTGTFTAGTTLASIGATTNVMLNHKIASLGTKASGATWVFTSTVTLS